MYFFHDILFLTLYTIKEVPMNEDILYTFENGSKYFRCPICKGKVQLKKQSLVCANNHSFDIAKQGYINYIMGKKQFKNYDKESFESRKAILDKGYYSHILDALVETIKGFERCTSILDVGCGEGYYARKIVEATDKDVIAFDISKDSVQIAARNDSTHGVAWFVGDLSQLPIKDNTIDCLLNIFTPANYHEFNRVLRKGGYLIKVVPGADHLKEFRQLVVDQLRNKEFSNERVVDYFDERFSIINQCKVSKTFEISEEDAKIFADMTPLFFNIDKTTLDLSAISHLTVEAEILIGRK